MSKEKTLKIMWHFSFSNSNRKNDLSGIQIVFHFHISVCCINTLNQMNRAKTGSRRPHNIFPCAHLRVLNLWFSKWVVHRYCVTCNIMDLCNFYWAYFSQFIKVCMHSGCNSFTFPHIKWVEFLYGRAFTKVTSEWQKGLKSEFSRSHTSHFACTTLSLYTCFWWQINSLSASLKYAQHKVLPCWVIVVPTG